MQGKRGFEDLDAYKLALQVVKEAYRVATLLPAEEKYNLASQIRRAATSITLNIAEGYGRYHYLDSLRFYYVARGSLEEVLSAFILCNELGYTKGALDQQRELYANTIRALNGYIRYVHQQKQGFREYGESSIKEENAFYETTP